MLIATKVKNKNKSQRKDTSVQLLVMSLSLVTSYLVKNLFTSVHGSSSGRKHEYYLSCKHDKVTLVSHDVTEVGFWLTISHHHNNSNNKNKDQDQDNINNIKYCSIKNTIWGVTIINGPSSMDNSDIGDCVINTVTDMESSDSMDSLYETKFISQGTCYVPHLFNEAWRDSKQEKPKNDKKLVLASLSFKSKSKYDNEYYNESLDIPGTDAWTDVNKFLTK